jgi:hypothetical protein
MIRPLLTSAVDGDYRSASRPAGCASVEIATGTHRRGRYVGLRAGLDAVQKGKIYCPRKNRSIAAQSVALPYTTELSQFL